VTTLVIRSPAALFLTVAWTWAFLLPLVLSPGPLHRYYLSQAGYILCYALAAGFWAGDLRSAWLQSCGHREALNLSDSHCAKPPS
jgi:hypothetical protein